MLKPSKARFPLPRLVMEAHPLRQPRDRTGLYTLTDHLIYAPELLVPFQQAWAGHHRLVIHTSVYSQQTRRKMGSLFPMRN